LLYDLDDFDVDDELSNDLMEDSYTGYVEADISLNESENPWEVSSASVFLKYCCPECQYSHQNLNDFQGNRD